MCSKPLASVTYLCPRDTLTSMIARPLTLLQPFCEHHFYSVFSVKTTSYKCAACSSSTAGHPSPASPLLIQLSKAQELHEQILTSYGPWLAAAPLSYTDDSFFIDSVPIAVTSRCRQNQKICSTTQGEQYDQEIFSWNQCCDFSQVKHISFAVASHISYVVF